MSLSSSPIARRRSSSGRALLLITLTLALFGLAGCRSSEPDHHSSAAPPAVAVGVAGGNGGEAASPSPSADRSLVVTMNVAMTVERVGETVDRIRAAVDRAGGFVADQQTSGTEGEQTARIELKIPANQARGLRSSLTDLGEITSSSEKVEDVTEQRADLEARLHNARVQEKRVLEILAGKASSIGELVEAEKELARVRENIERLEAQDRVMKSRITLATIHLTLTTRSVGAWRTPGPSLSRAAKVGVEGAAAFAVYSGIAFVTVAPTLVPIALLVVGIVALVRRRARVRASVAG
jgi:Ca-activated chloride channel homolog